MKKDPVLKVRQNYSYTDFFTVDQPDQFFVDFKTTEKAYNRISKTAKVGSVILHAALCSIPAALVTAPLQISELTAGLGAFMLAGIAVGIGLNRTSKMMHENFVSKNGLPDYINLLVYRENKRLEKWLNETEDSRDGLLEQIKLIKNHLNHLVDLQLKAAVQIGIVDEFTEQLLEDGQGDIRRIINNKKESTSSLLSSYDYIAKHIAKNKQLYYAVVPELKQSVDYCVNHVSNLEKIKDPTNSQEYFEKRLDLEYQQPVANQFNDEQDF